MNEKLIAAAAALLALSWVIWILLRKHREKVRFLPMDEMEGQDFEYYCAELLLGSGFTRAEVTRASGDYGVDIIADRDGVTYAIQCKCYDAEVGVPAVQQVYAGRDYYGCMVGAVMTNQYFTRPAQNMADRLHILLWDRDVLKDMAGE